MKLKLEELNKKTPGSDSAGNISALLRIFRKYFWMPSKTRNNDSMQLVVCLNYGGRQEILDAVNKMIGDGVSLPVTEDVFRKYLYLPDLPDPDLLSDQRRAQDEQFLVVAGQLQ